MYARVASFEGRDPSLTDELIDRVRKQGPSTVPNARGFLGLFDRERGTSLGVTFFDSEQAIRESEQAFEDMAQHFSPEMRGRRTSVETYEVVIQEGGENANAARVTSLEGSPQQLDESFAKTNEEILPRARQLAGWKGMFALADRSSGRVKVINLYESSAALRASEEQANKLRQDVVGSTGQRIAGVEEYEVAVSERLSEVRA
jgi:hypothetical protein